MAVEPEARNQMPPDMTAWSTSVKSAVAWLANEDAQRRSWYGLGPEVDSPDEAFCGFFDDAAVEEYIKRQDTGLSPYQLDALARITSMMRKLSSETPMSIDREIGPDFIDDPRWQ